MMAGEQPHLPDAAVESARDALFDALCTLPGTGLCDLELNGEQWAWLEGTALDHRLMPLLHKAVLATGARQWPRQLVAKCERGYRAQSLRWLDWQTTIRSCSAILDEAGIAHVYLKGASLALSIYPEGGLRPMRDLDILIDPERAEDAHGLLIDRGYEPLLGAKRSVSQSSYQLAAIRNPERNTVVELHRALAPNDLYQSGPLTRYLLDTAQPTAMGGISVPISHPLGLHAHLLLHAGVKSNFDCGPIILADLAFLEARHPELLDEFGETARRFGLARSHLLFSRLLAKHGTSTARLTAAEIDDAELSDNLLKHSSRLLVLPSANVRKRKIARDLQRSKSVGQKTVAFISAALQPTRAKIAAATGHRVDAPYLLLLYPLWLFDRLRLLLSARSDADLSGDVVLDLELARWLAVRDA